MTVPTWSADGQSIYFTSLRSGGPRQIWRIAAEGGEPVQITRDGGAKAWESSDGRFLYYGDDTPAIWRMPAAWWTADARVSPSGWYGHTAASGYLLRPGIYWLNGHVASRPAIELFAFATGRSVPSITLAGPYDDGSGFSVSKDGRWVVFSQRDYEGSEHHVGAGVPIVAPAISLTPEETRSRATTKSDAGYSNRRTNALASLRS